MIRWGTVSCVTPPCVELNSVASHNISFTTHEMLFGRTVIPVRSSPISHPLTKDHLLPSFHSIPAITSACPNSCIIVNGISSSIACMCYGATSEKDPNYSETIFQSAPSLAFICNRVAASHEKFTPCDTHIRRGALFYFQGTLGTPKSTQRI